MDGSVNGSVDAEPRVPARASAQTVLADWTRALAAIADIARCPERTLPRLIDEIAAQNGNAPALLSDGERFTYAELSARTHDYARWARNVGLTKDNVVALLMENRPEYLAVWLGLTRAGIVVALLNTNLREAGLAHCVDAAGAKAAIVSTALSDVWRSADSHLKRAPRIWIHGGSTADEHGLDLNVASTIIDDAEMLVEPVTITDRALLIYTSGTTGLPKAANVSHGRVLSWALWFAGMLDTRSADRMYDCLPLYHSVGGVVAVSALLARGGSVVIAPAFSASRFFDDIERWDCTLAQYIGELCRYLLAASSDREQGTGKLRALCGNGLRRDVWDVFAQRFPDVRIVEFYAASEGTFSLYNMEGEPGAIGRVPSFLRHRFPAAIVQYDETVGAPRRDPTGRCLRVKTGEPGEAIGRVATGRADPNAFQGYTDRGATEAKLLRDVFADGDLWVRTGDLMRTDGRGFWYFVDRIGETFRWKGENVSTLEVASALVTCPGVNDAVVYGVVVPGAEGRAGMASLSVGPTFDLAELAHHAKERLPSYARPLFLRLLPSIELTGTFKHRTAVLADAGFDPSKTLDPLFVFDPARNIYVSLDGEAFGTLMRGERRF